MGFYRLTTGQHKELDIIRSRFFWQGGSDKFKYHMVNCESICRPKDYGGFGGHPHPPVGHLHPEVHHPRETER